MGKIIVKIGVDVMEDLKRIKENPRVYGNPGGHTIYLKDSKQLYALLSPKRIDLLRQIISYGEKSTIGSITRQSMRKQEAISRDITMLESAGLVEKKRHRRNVHLKVPCKAIEIRLAD